MATLDYIIISALSFFTCRSNNDPKTQHQIIAQITVPGISRTDAHIKDLSTIVRRLYPYENPNAHRE